MLVRNAGLDIVQAIGGIGDGKAALALLENAMDGTHFSRMRKVDNLEVLLKIANAVAMCEPETVFVNTGSEEDRRCIRELALSNGEEAPLAMPNHTIHFDLKEEQGRIIDRTYYIVNEGEQVSSLANKMLRAEALEDMREKMAGIMAGQDHDGRVLHAGAGRSARRPTRPLKSPARPMSPTALKSCTATPMPCSTGKWND